MAEENKKPGAVLRWGLGLLAVVLTCLYPCVFLFTQNAGEARAADMLPFLGLFLATAAVGLLLSLLVLRDITRGAVITCAGMLVVINFSLAAGALERALPWLYSRYLFVLVLLILAGLLTLLFLKKPDLTVLCGLISLALGVMLVMNLVLAAPKILSGNARPVTMGVEECPTVAESRQKNVYYLIFDEYGGQENLDFYFGFDNSDFWNELETRGFSVSRTSRNEESCWTDTLVPNMLNLSYVCNDDMPEKVRRSYLEMPLLAEIFDKSGYRVNVINHRAFLRMHWASELTHDQQEDNITEYLFDNSIYSKLPWVRDRINFLMFKGYRDNYLGPVWDAITALEGCADLAEGPTLTISYIQCPHAPFIFAADGAVRDLSQNRGWYWKDPSLYTDQLRFINSVILTTVDNILEKDPEAVILLMSDHGARVSLHMVEQFGGPRFDAARETGYMQNMLCAVRVPGGSPDIEGDTAINAARKTLDAAFGLGLGTVQPRTGYILPENFNAKEP